MGNHIDLIGTPFEYGGRGPKTFDCYGLVREMHKRAGLDIPDYRSPSDSVRITQTFLGNLHLWEPTEPKEGAVAYITFPGRDGAIWTHCGYLVNDHQMLHTWKKSGGVLLEPTEVWKRRIKGYFRYVG